MRARARYALLSVDEKEARNKKAREKRQQKKEESQGGNQYGATVNGPHEDMSNLTTAELNRKLVQEWYASLTPEQKDDRNKKAREKRKCKVEAEVLNMIANNNVRGNYPTNQIVFSSIPCHIEIVYSSGLIRFT
uniref:Uncharacterized protein n=1 Tax=Oryza barthii TaxID=65489 RepID=A0A0D3HU19_9ORYZ